MVCGDDPIVLSRGLLTDAAYYLPSILAMRQSGNLYVYCVNDPVQHVDPSGEGVILVWLAKRGIEIIGRAAIEGAKSGISYAINEKSVLAGVANGVASGATEGIISADGPVGVAISSRIGSAVGTFAEEMLFNNGKIDSEMARIVAQAAAYDLILNLPKMYWNYAIDVAIKADSVASEIGMTIDPQFGSYMKTFFDTIVEILGGAG